jgi:ribonuclease P protein subunit RPR2
MKRKLDRKTVQERAEQLFGMAAEVFDQNPGLANRYVDIARKLCMKNRIRMPAHLKRRFCTHCYRYLVPGKNARVRITGKTVTTFCMECKRHTRLPYRKIYKTGNTVKKA